MDIALDNSSLSELVSRERQDQLIDRVRYSSARLVIPIVALSECLTQRDLGQVELRARMLVRVAEALGDDFVIGEDWHVLRRLEWKSRRLRRTPSLPKWERLGILDHLRRRDFRQEHSASLPSLRKYLAKDQSLALDRLGRDQIHARLPELDPSQLPEILEPFDRVFLASPSHFFECVTKSRRHRARVRRSPADFPATVILGSYLYLNAIGASFARLGYGPYSDLLRGPQKGSWVDARTVASSAYASFLLTEDENMQRKANFIRDAFHIGPCTPPQATWVTSDDTGE